MAATALRIDRLVSRCRVPAGTRPGPGLATALGEGLPALLEQAVAGADLDGYWMIRRLDVRTGVGADWTARQTGRALARAVGAEVDRRARRGRDADGVLWFPDREAFVAAFLLDLARGRAAGRWEYDGFASVTEWPRAARELARGEPAVLQEALSRLNPTEVQELCERVDGDRLLEVLAGERGPVRPVLAALEELRLEGRLTCTRSTGLLLALTAVRHSPLELSLVARAAIEVAALVRLVTAADPATAAGISAAVAEGRWADLSALTGPTDAIVALRAWPSEDRAGLAEACACTPEVARPARMHTRFGGAFLLLPLLPDLWPWQAATAAWSGTGGAAPDRLAKLAVLACALGAARFAAVLEDPALRTALAVPGGVDVRSWLSTLDPAPFVTVAGLSPDDPVEEWLRPPVAAFLGTAATEVLKDLGRRLPGMAGASAAYLWRNVLDVEAWVTLADPETDDGTVAGTDDELDTHAVVELGHAPLSVLLSLTGLSRSRFVVEGAGERTWTLTSRS